MSERKVMVNIEIGVGVPESVLEGMDRDNLGFLDLMTILRAAMSDDMGVYYNNQLGTLEYEDEIL